MLFQKIVNQICVLKTDLTGNFPNDLYNQETIGFPGFLGLNSYPSAILYDRCTFRVRKIQVYHRRNISRAYVRFCEHLARSQFPPVQRY